MMSAIRHAWNGRRLAGKAVVAAAMVLLSGTAHAINYSEGAAVTTSCTDAKGITYTGIGQASDFSSTASSPTSIGTLSVGSNLITGATIPYGPVSNMATGELTCQDSDYFTFMVPTGTVLSRLLFASSSTPVPGTILYPSDLAFIGIAAGNSVTVTPPSSAGLLGFTLVPSGTVGSSDILPAIGAASPPGFSMPPFTGATTFSGPLPAGTYSVWILDGDHPAYYSLDLQVSAVPEPAAWAMLILGLGLVGGALRRRGASPVHQSYS